MMRTHKIPHFKRTPSNVKIPKQSNKENTEEKKLKASVVKDLSYSFKSKKYSESTTLNKGESIELMKKINNSLAYQ